MDTSMTERLSRFIDGDLGPKEAEELTTLLESDPALRRELDGMRRVRASFRSLAQRDNPPVELDALVDPLLRGRPESKLARPWMRWLATAAAAILGVTVVLEVSRRQPDTSVRNWQERAREQAAQPEERFTLAPLPSSSVPTQERPLGAADRLINAPRPEVEPVLDPPPALEVLGPLETGDISEPVGPDRLVSHDEVSGQQTQQEADTIEVEKRRSAATRAPGTPPETTTVLAGEGGAVLLGRPTGKAARKLDVSAEEARGSGAQLFVFMAAETAWRSFEPEGRCEAGRYALRIRVESGLVREVWPVANPQALTRQVRASQLVLGLEVADVPDGEYSAEVVVEPRRSPNR